MNPNLSPSLPRHRRVRARLLVLLVAAALAVASAISFTACSTSPERSLMVAAQISQTTVSNAVVAWSEDFVRRAQPHVVTNVLGRREIDYAQAPHLAAEKALVDRALADWRAGSRAALGSWIAVRELGGTHAVTDAQLDRFRDALAASATNVLHLIHRTP